MSGIDFSFHFLFSLVGKLYARYNESKIKIRLVMYL